MNASVSNKTMKCSDSAERRIALAQGRARTLGVVVAGVLGMSPSYLLADAWFFEPSASIKATGDDNVFLRTADPVSVSGAVAGAGAKLSLESEATEFYVEPAVEVQRYTDDSSIDDTYLFLRSGGKLKGERNEIGFTADVRQDSTLTSEVETSGLTSTVLDRNYYAFTPSYSYKLTERASLGLSYSLQRADYEAQVGSSYVDWGYDVATGTFSYRLTEIDDATVSLYRGNYETSGGATEFLTSGASIGLSHRYSERVTGQVGVGATNVERRFLLQGAGPQIEESNALTLDLGIVGKLERGDFSVGVTRQLVPTGIGEVAEQDGLRLALSHQFDERLIGTLSGTALKLRNVAGSDETYDRSYRSVGGELAWQWTPEWSVTGGYRYSWQKYDSATDDATSNRVDVGLSYKGSKRNL